MPHLKAIQLLVDTAFVLLTTPTMFLLLERLDHQGLDRLKTAAKNFGAESAKVQAGPLVPASLSKVERVM